MKKKMYLITLALIAMVAVSGCDPDKPEEKNIKPLDPNAKLYRSLPIPHDIYHLIRRLIQPTIRETIPQTIHCILHQNKKERCACLFSETNRFTSQVLKQEPIVLLQRTFRFTDYIIQRMIKRHCSFSQVVTMLRITLMYYTDFIGFMENPDKEEQTIISEQSNSPPQPSLFPDYQRWGLAFSIREAISQ